MTKLYFLVGVIVGIAITLNATLVYVGDPSLFGLILSSASLPIALVGAAFNDRSNKTIKTMIENIDAHLWK